MFCQLLWESVAAIHSDLQSALRRTELTEFVVRTVGFRSFDPKLPFSFVIKERVDGIVFAAKQQRELYNVVQHCISWEHIFNHWRTL
jgi:hypothetical protein